MARLSMLANYVLNFDIRPHEHLPALARNLETLLAATG